MDNSIVAGNTASWKNPDLSSSTGTITAHYSLIGDNAGTSLAEAQSPDAHGNLIGSSAGGGVIDPLLAGLANNGGPTLTHALLPGSPSMDAGDPLFVPPPDFDQRGNPFARVVGARIDMGAFEDQSADTTPPVVTVDPLLTDDSSPELTGTIDSLTLTIAVDVGGQIGLAATNNGDGTWTLADNTIAPRRWPMARMT